MRNRNRLTSYLRTRVCVLSIAAMLLTLPGTKAAEPEPASGYFFPCFNYAAPPRQVGDNLIIMFNVTGTGTGTFTGSFVGTEMDVVHRDGSINLHGSLVFNGQVGNNSGSLIFTYEGVGSAGTGHENLHAVGNHGADGLAGVHTNIALEGEVGGPNSGCDLSGAGTYTGQILFDP